MGMPGRKYSIANTNYRYGFNGKENDNEIEGQQDYGFRIYDKRLVRFKSVDPITKQYPELTPYQFASNRPIDGVDRDGLEYAAPPGYTDPKQLLYQAGGEISGAFANIGDKFSAKVEAGYTWFKELFTKGNTKVSIEKTTKYSAGATPNFTNFLSYVKNNNSSEGAPPIFNTSFGKTQSLSIITEEQVGNISFKNTVSLDSKGVSKDKSSASFSTFFSGIPADISINTSKNSSQENSLGIGFTLKDPKFAKVPFSLDYTQSENGAKKVEVKAGAEVKIGEKSGLKLFGNSNFGISF